MVKKKTPEKTAAYVATLREKSVGKLKELIDQGEVELVQVKAEIGLGRSKNVRGAMAIRRDIARMKTVLREKQLLEEEKR